MAASDHILGLLVANPHLRAPTQLILPFWLPAGHGQLGVGEDMSRGGCGTGSSCSSSKVKSMTWVDLGRKLSSAALKGYMC